jgi:hypothetical protein
VLSNVHTGTKLRTLNMRPLHLIALSTALSIVFAAPTVDSNKQAVLRLTQNEASDELGQWSSSDSQRGPDSKFDDAWDEEDDLDDNDDDEYDEDDYDDFEDGDSEPALTVPTTVPATPAKRTLKGRFLHITDLHPDPFYASGVKVNEKHACHRSKKKPKKGKPVSGWYGTPYECVLSPLYWLLPHSYIFMLNITYSPQ